MFPKANGWKAAPPPATDVGETLVFCAISTVTACPVKAEFERAAREAVSALARVDQVEVVMTANTRGRAQSPGADAKVLPGIIPIPRCKYSGIDSI